jgi:hypothetical protein
MQLLGNYQSNLPTWYYDELIDLVNKAISSGDYAGGYSFDQTNIDAIETEAQAFSDITLPSAGDRALDEDFNYPLGLLAARYNAISQEVNDFTAKISVLIDVLNKDTTLLDQLLYAVDLNEWVANQHPVAGATVYSQGFGAGYGSIGYQLSLIDPANSVLYAYPLADIVPVGPGGPGFHGPAPFTPASPSPFTIYPAAPQTTKYYNTSSQVLTNGLIPGANTSTITPTELTWTYDAVGFTEASTGTDWAGLSFLESNILLNYNAPQIQVVLPTNTLAAPFYVTGESILQGIPVYIRTLFQLRQLSLDFYNGINTVASTTRFNILPGDQVNVSVGVTTTSGTNGSCSVYLQYRDSSGVLVVDTHSNTILTLVGSLAEAGSINNLVTCSSQANIVTCELVLIETGVSIGSYALATDCTVNTPIRLTNGYAVEQNSLAVYSSDTYYQANTDYVVTGNGYVTLIGVPDNTTLTITFNEYYPAYQCSINQSNWSQVIMFDYLRPYPDNETEFLPISIGVDSNGVRNKLPIVDESGNATGLYIYLNGVMTGQYLLQIYQDADPSTCGKQVALTVDFGSPTFMNVLNLSSYTNLPVTIQSIDYTEFTGVGSTNLFSGALVLDKPTAIRFATTLVSSFTITLLQTNYTIKQHQIVPDDYLRREAINDLQSIIPVAAQEPNILPEVIFADGYQYEFGLEDISAANEVYTLPTVFISGPYSPSFRVGSITLNADYKGTVSFYVCYQAYGADGTLIDSNLIGNALTPGVSIPFGYTSMITLSDITTMKLYLRIVLRSADASVKAFMLQVD